MPVAPPQSDTRYCQRRDESDSDRHTCQRSRDLLIIFNISSGDARRNGDQHIEYGRREPRCHLVRHLPDRRQVGDQHCRSDCQHHANADRLDRIGRQALILPQYPHTETDDRLHQRRQNHRTDDHRTGVDKKSQRGDHRGDYQQDNEGSTDVPLFTQAAKKGSIALFGGMPEKRQSLFEIADRLLIPGYIIDPYAAALCLGRCLLLPE